MVAKNQWIFSSGIRGFHRRPGKMAFSSDSILDGLNFEEFYSGNVPAS
jgi:hypothetical protein